MKTFSFIGSDKNAGKTTSFNFIVSQLKNSKICLTSIGINGEFFDSLENHSKPAIVIPRGALFVTTPEQLKSHPGTYEILEFLHTPLFSKNFVLAKALDSKEFILEGPNQKNEILILKNLLKSQYPDITLLIDGSIDRQFLGHPLVSDGFYFSLLISNKTEQREKAKNLLFPLRFNVVKNEIKDMIEKFKKDETRSLLFINNKICHEGREIPSIDKELNQKIRHQILNDTHKKILYLNGALTKPFYHELAPCKNLILVLDNFTLFQNISSDPQKRNKFLPEIYLLFPLQLNGIFFKEEQGNHSSINFEIPQNVPQYNIFREIPNEITTES